MNDCDIYLQSDYCESMMKRDDDDSTDRISFKESTDNLIQPFTPFILIHLSLLRLQC